MKSFKQAKQISLAFVLTLLLGAWSLTVLAGGKWAHNVTVGGIDYYPDSSEDGTFAISVNARVDYEGNSTGWVQWDTLDGTPLSYGTIQCLAVVENRAYMTYIAEGGTWEAYGTPGHVVYLSFEDNGEGKNAAPDYQSYIYYNFPGSSTDCTGLPDAGDWIQPGPVEWLHGNVQIR